MTTQQIEVAVARKFGARQNIIVPNVSWGMNIHECDLMIIRPSGFAVEVEIKTSMSDLKKDFLKKHKHESVMIKEFYYAFPKEMLEKGIKLIPEKAGIIICENKIFRYHYDNKPTLRYII